MSNQLFEQHLERVKHTVSAIQLRDFLALTKIFDNPVGIACYVEALRRIVWQESRIVDLEKKLALKTDLIARQQTEINTLKQQVREYAEVIQLSE